MRGRSTFRSLFGCFMALACVAHVTPVLAGVSPPQQPAPASPAPAGEDYPDSCLAGDSYFTTDNGPVEVYDPASGIYTPLENINSDDGRCSSISAGSSIVGEEITRLLLTEYFNRMSGALRHRIAGGFFGGGNGVAGNGHVGQYGRAAGDGLADWGGWSPWISYGRTMADNDLASTRYDANQDNVLFGMDYSYSDRLIFGISGGYENNDVTTAFNLGEMEVQGFTIAPYAAYLLTDSISIDAAVGYSDLDIDQFRTEPGGAMVRGDTDASRWFVMSNLSTFHRYGNWVLSGRAGLIYSEEEQDGFTEAGGTTAQTVADRDIDYGQLSFGGEVAYSAHAIEPFASLYYEYDFEQGSTRLNPNQLQPDDDDDDFRLGAGFRYFGSNGLSAVLEYSGIAGRENFDSHTVNLMGRLQF